MLIQFIDADHRRLRKRKEKHDPSSMAGLTHSRKEMAQQESLITGILSPITHSYS